ncbi:chaperonin 10-like protein [Apodospora peruviana]|uniref:Chaperonin 10-like protein n=1 Tax=Apodospora peruviana TaxID=516989 RepID=A0AAE0IKI4_9PEZI|nr:chaperonin 10-like protein [Apodospora peruviana]
MANHLAAICRSKGLPFEVESRPTPKPGPGDLLIAVKSVALNPADVLIQDTGLLVPSDSYPTVIGFDMSGLVLEVGDGVPLDTFVPSKTRVAAYTASYWRSYNPDYGTFQEKCLVPWQHCAVMPDGVSWNEAATLPVAVQTALSAWALTGISFPPDEADGNIAAEKSNAREDSKPEEREALLIWGASSSVGTMGVQAARLLRDHPHSLFSAVYATAGPTNMNYVSSLGADRVFDYRDPDVVKKILSAARENGLVIRHCFLAMGDLAPCQAILASFLAADDNSKGGKAAARIASAPMLPTDGTQAAIDDIETVFVFPPVVEEERLRQFESWMGKRLTGYLAKGAIRPSPEPKVVGKGRGLDAIQHGLDILRGGVSCTKLVVEIHE